MPISQGQNQPLTYRFRYQGSLATNAANLSAIDLSGTDTILVDDTGGSGTCVLTLPKMATALAPLGMRITIRKASTVAFAVQVTSAADNVSGTAGAYPSSAGSTVLHLPASVPNSVTFEAMALDKTTGLPAAVTPSTGGLWMNVASSVASV